MHVLFSSISASLRYLLLLSTLLLNSRSNLQEGMVEASGATNSVDWEARAPMYKMLAGSGGHAQHHISPIVSSPTMFSLKTTIVLALLALCNSAVAKDKPMYTCNAGGVPSKLLQSTVNSAFAKAPDTATPGLSGFPHVFGNEEGLAFPAACLNRAAGTTLMELPVLTSGKAYAYNTKPRPESGPYRIVYTVANGKKQTFCGLMAHVPPANRKFELCTAP
ncbi:hypothetical protein HYDPIDRAFT_26338 [Hydnomerulius pinastri MD-312]|nr:hypothetical protein HYDPIDRAFT_26338 [Hydnomerulius pinastri MD-312]